LLEATRGLKRLAEAVWWGEQLTEGAPGGGRETSGQPMERYVTGVFQSLAVFRLFTFGLGAWLVFLLNPSDQRPEVLAGMVFLVGAFNIYRILKRFDPARSKDPVQRVSLGVDLLLSFAIILLSGGLDSPFLIYSLSPILTTSLLLDLRGALAFAAVLALCVSGIHVLAGVGLGNLPWVLSGNYLVLSLLYWAVCLLVVYLPFLANLNWQRRVRSESLALERQRLRRDVHDNVAQTLAFLSLKMKLAQQRTSRGRSPITERDVAEIGSIVERAYLSVRDYLDGAVEENNDLLRAGLTAVVDQWRRDTSLQVDLAVKGEEGELASQVKFQMLQVAREALANVAKHAYSKHVWVDLECTPQQVKIRVRDDGRGFSASGIRGHGMGIMSERAALAGATLDINSIPGKGTEVVVAYPRGEKQGDA
jgi:signal transduction histidine kinase